MLSLPLALVLTLAPGTLATVPVTPSTAPAPDQLDFPMAARSFAEGKGIENAQPHQVEPFALLGEHYARFRLGTFEIHVPATALGDRKRFKDIQMLSAELLDAQLRWLDWIASSDAAKKEVKDLKIAKHAKTVHKWIKGLRGKTMEHAFKKGQRDFTPGEGDKEAMVESARVLTDYLGRGGPLGLERTEPELTPLYLIPDRKEFVELACLFGWVYSNLRHEYWQEDTWSWTQFYYEDSWFIALEFAAAEGEEGEEQGFTGDYTRGTPMTHFADKGLRQQVVQLALRALFNNLFGDRISPTFSAGFSSLLVVDLYGLCDTRTDGDLRPGKTQARSVFVSGGASGGGALPPDYADGRFRSPNHGSDYFIPVLRMVQKHGAKRARNKADKHRSFVIMDDDEKEEFLLQAPVLHFSAEKSVHPPTEEFRGDLLEFLRAYRICFVHWLRTVAEGSAGKSNRAFAEFLSVLASPDGTVDKAVELVYDQPLSNEAVSKSCLEGRFLRWLAKQ